MLDQLDKSFVTRNGISDILAAEIRSLIKQQPINHSLSQQFYISEDIYRLEIDEVLMKHWHCAGHQSQITEPGEYIVFEFDKESVIILRGMDGEIRALANVCRHRGSRICDKSGKAQGSMLVCPYHGWCYAFDGSLKRARMMPRDFDTSGHGLRQLPLRVIQGLIFVSFSDNPLAIDAAEETAHGIFGLYDWANAKAIHQHTFTFKANWKLGLENQVECLHCAPAHPELFKLQSQAAPNEENLRQQLAERTRDLGLEFLITDQWALNAQTGQEMTFSDRVSMRPGVLSATEDGKLVAPLMGNLETPDGGFSQYYVGPHNHFIAYSDYGVMFCYVPKSVDETNLTVTWLVRSDAEDSVDYDREQVTWLWELTAGADKEIVERNQQGVGSRFFQPGPYALPVEEKTNRFIGWYLDVLSNLI